VFPLFYTGLGGFSDSKTLAGKKPYGASLGFFAVDYLLDVWMKNNQKIVLINPPSNLLS